MKRTCAWLASIRETCAGGWLAQLATVLMMAAALSTPSAAETRFVFANESPYDTMDPHAAFDVGRVAVRLNLYDGLYRWLDNPPVLHPWLAESHTVSADGLTYTFKLRKGVKFHDGAEVTADDVVLQHGAYPRAEEGRRVACSSTMVSPGATKAVDKYTVQFTLTKPTAIFMAVMPEIHVVNSALLKKHEKDGDWGGAWLTSNDAGSGSYAAQPVRPRDRVHREALPRPLHALGRRSTSTRSSSGSSRKTTRACSA